MIKVENLITKQKKKNDDRNSSKCNQCMRLVAQEKHVISVLLFHFYFLLLRYFRLVEFCFCTNTNRRVKQGKSF